jgi:hypothetical protein
MADHAPRSSAIVLGSALQASVGEPAALARVGLKHSIQIRSRFHRLPGLPVSAVDIDVHILIRYVKACRSEGPGLRFEVEEQEIHDGGFNVPIEIDSDGPSDRAADLRIEINEKSIQLNMN